MTTAFRATYSDFKLVKTRKVAQLIFEVPLEAVDEALGVVGGMPNPAEERWFGIAAINGSAPEVAKEKKDWRDLQPSAQAAIRCNEPTFVAFLREQHEVKGDDIPQAVRNLCCVNSRKDLNTNHQARMLWTMLDKQYLAWKAAEHA